jgi:propionaldehyde dehydrogenase
MDAKALEQLIKQVVEEELSAGKTTSSGCGYRKPSSKSGIFDTVDEAVAQAKRAQEKYADLSLAQRKEIITAIRAATLPKIEVYARDSAQETGLGNAKDKMIKNKIAIEGTPGVEDLITGVQTGDFGLTLYELSPYGVVGAVTPSTNPTETIISNSIGMLAAGNAVFFAPHPGAKRVCIDLIEELNTVVKETCGIDNLIVTTHTPSVENAKMMMEHPDIPILVVTGGEAVVKVAMKTGKKVIAAGAGNPPVLVDETANIELAAKNIVNGASFDHNILCIAEKSVLVVESVADYLIFQMEKQNALLIQSQDEIDKLMGAILVDGKEINRKLIGKSVATILEAAGISCDFSPRLIMIEVEKGHPLVMKEQLMPVLPIVRLPDFESVLQEALIVEQKLHHTAIMHSQNIPRLNLAGRKLQTSIFVKNGPSYAGLGFEGEGDVTYTIATPTGEGTTTARHFARTRRCVLTDGFSIR